MVFLATQLVLGTGFYGTINKGSFIVMKSVTVLGDFQLV